MGEINKAAGVGDARIKKREQIVELPWLWLMPKLATIFILSFPPLCAIDIVMVAGAPWLKEALERDYSKDESGYKKIGGGG